MPNVKPKRSKKAVPRKVEILSRVAVAVAVIAGVTLPLNAASVCSRVRRARMRETQDRGLQATPL